MNPLMKKQYRCQVCDNVSWRQEECHEKRMKELCFCGSGKFLEDCHGSSQPTNHKPTAK
ncbi:MAG: SEC-C domain-containing protein [Candidatus Kerfeldbacteria bacterium]|nr:SEC-C domain-containing protein [Candidatus Kerfeldbacteria bacterium]